MHEIIIVVMLIQLSCLNSISHIVVLLILLMIVILVSIGLRQTVCGVRLDSSALFDTTVTAFIALLDGHDMGLLGHYLVTERFSLGD